MAQLIIACRVLVFAAILTLIHLRHEAFQRHAAILASDVSEMLPQARQVFPSAAMVLPAELGASPAPGTLIRSDVQPDEWEQVTLPSIVDDQQRVLGYMLRTSPQADHILGFSGPTDVLMLFNADHRAVSVSILSSGDTHEHVQQVLNDSKFLSSLHGQSPHELRSGLHLDAVSGATLTSLAILEAIRFRLMVAEDREGLTEGEGILSGGKRHDPVSLRFPDPPRLQDVQLIFPAANAVALEPYESGFWTVFNARQEVLGRILRTSPAADSVVGYQGPADTLIGVDSDGVVSGIAVGHSYDNEPYVDYVREDTWFRNLFSGRTLDQLATFNAREERIEGVSGATMTSMAVIEAIQTSAKAALERQRSEQQQQQQQARSTPATSIWPKLLTLRNLSTISLTIAGAMIGLTRLRGVRWLRIGFQLVLIVWLGLINGDMVSQASLLGWTQNGIPWRNAAGLVVLSLAALLIPVMSGHNVYCAHICPHGAVQQLIRQRLPWKLKLSRSLRRNLKLLPWLLIVWVMIIGMLHLPYSAVDIEPFDAWVWSIAGWGTLGVAVVGLLASAVMPMAYCRFGCPTGAVLNFLVRPRRAGWQLQDAAAMVLLALAIVLYFF